jgi:hypothetical protein
MTFLREDPLMSLSGKFSFKPLIWKKKEKEKKKKKSEFTCDD